jgi:hypothetical protein
MTWLEGVAAWWLLTPPLTVGVAFGLALHRERVERRHRRERGACHGPLLWSGRDELLFRVEAARYDERQRRTN